MKRLLLKICGVRDGRNIASLAGCGADYLGFVFVPESPRNAADTLSGELLRAIPAGARKVCVIVDRLQHEVDEIIEKFPFDALQLHGSESAEYCGRLKRRFPALEIIKAIRVSPPFDFETLRRYEGAVDRLLFDGSSPGSGRKFDWSELGRYRGSLPFLLSGGISPEDAPLVRKLAAVHPLLCGVDINSRFETAPGLKSIEKVERFIEELRCIQ